ncbi:ROK family transcriptional regulator [Glycomyces sp. NPDC047369]
MRAFGSDTRLPTVALVLDLLRERTQVSRIELAQATGLTRATMTNAVRKLIDLGFVHEVGTTRSQRGTPRRLLELQPDACHMVGLQFDRFRGVAVVVDLAGSIVARRELPVIGERGPEEVVPELASAVCEMIDASTVAREGIRGIGIATYGPQDRNAGVLLTPQPAPEWQGYPLASAVAEATGLPVAIENDATAAGIGAQHLGTAPSNFAVVYMSGGIGGGLIIDGHPYRGATSNGLELGHISVHPAGAVCGCGNRGCLDNVASPVAVAHLASRTSLAVRLGLGADPLEAFGLVGRAAADGDAEAAGLIDASVRNLAAATVTLVNLLDVGSVVLAGSAFTEFGDRYRDAVQEALDQSVFMRHVHSVNVELAGDLAHAAAVGAAMVVLRNLLEEPSLGGRSAEG